MVYIYIQCNISHKKEWNSTVCKNMNGPKEYYARWNKSDRERQILYVITYMWNLKTKTSECI